MDLFLMFSASMSWGIWCCHVWTLSSVQHSEYDVLSSLWIQCPVVWYDEPCLYNVLIWIGCPVVWCGEPCLYDILVSQMLESVQFWRSESCVWHSHMKQMSSCVIQWAMCMTFSWSRCPVVWNREPCVWCSQESDVGVSPVVTQWAMCIMFSYESDV